MRDENENMNQVNQTNKIMKIGAPSATQVKKGFSLHLLKVPETYKMILKNLILSCIPLIVLPSYKYFMDEKMDLVVLLKNIIASPEVVYICILILMTLDSIKNLRKIRLGTFKIVFFSVVVGCIFYIIMRIAEYESKGIYNQMRFVYVNTIFLISTLIISFIVCKEMDECL